MVRKTEKTAVNTDLLNLKGDDFDTLVNNLASKQLERSAKAVPSREGTKKSKIKKILDAVITKMFESKESDEKIIDLKVADIIADLRLKPSDRIMINEALEEICDERRWKGVERIGHTLLIHRDPVDEQTVVARKEARFRERQQARARYSKKRTDKASDSVSEVVE